MGTRADFYVGRGERAEWLGSIAWDGYPDGIEVAVLSATTEADFRDAFAAWAKKRDDASLPEDGWPWPWDTSSTTDYAYAIDGGTVWRTHCTSGRDECWVDRHHDCNGLAEDECPAGAMAERASFPNMSDVERVTYGKRSGVILIGVAAAVENASNRGGGPR